MTKMQIFKTSSAALFCAVLTASSGFGQDTLTPSPQTPPPVTQNGALIGGQLRPEAIAGAAVAVAVISTIASDDDETAATTTSSTR